MFEKLKAALNVKEKVKGFIKVVVLEVLEHTEVNVGKDGATIRFRKDLD